MGAGYGVLANAVAQQTHDIGLRLALGASRGRVLWRILGRALTLTLGLFLGLAGAFVTTRAMAGFLYGVRPTDTTTYAGAAALLALLTTIGALVPAWRATRVDPLVVLRAE
ncbi:MAG TPA: FtsX-like permease family protein [Vicinamibacterales bacterium]